MRNRRGFTLIELLIVIIIVGILAAVSIPMMTANVNAARATEAIASLGAIRTQMRIENATTGAYNTNVAVGNVVPDNPEGFPVGSLNGHYWDDNDYTISAVAAGTFIAQCAPAAGGTAPESNLVAGFNAIEINQDGTITQPN